MPGDGVDYGCNNRSATVCTNTATRLAGIKMHSFPKLAAYLRLLLQDPD